MAADFNPPLFSSSPRVDPKLIDSPQMRSAGRELLSLALMDARNHTLHLFAQFEAALKAADLKTPSAAMPHPPLWQLGHIAWFQEWWIGRNMQRALGSACDPLQARLASIEPNADRWWQVVQTSTPALSLPDVAHCRAYALDTLESTLELLDKKSTPSADSDDALYFFRLALFHEDMRSEALVGSAQALGLRFDKPLVTAFTPQPMMLREPLLLPACHWALGSAAGAAGFAFDNELAAHSVSVPEFEIDAQVVSWAQFVEFVDDGAYDREELWHPDGWLWLQALAQGEGRRGPRYVDQIGVASGAVMQSRFGQATRMLGNQPALHVTWWEADAWCRWAGRRLPAEVEWEIAAHTAGRRGFQWGSVWEWVGTTFRPYPGFAPGPWQACSEPAFGTHKVLRGGSFATRARLKSPKFRHFQRPEHDEAFCGFRSCAL